MRVYFKLFSRVLRNDKRALRVRVYHKTKARIFDRSVNTGLSIVPKFWDKANERVTDLHPSQQVINERIAEIKNNREDLLNQFDSGKISPEAVLNQIIEKRTDESIDDFIETKVKDIKSDSVYVNHKNCLRGFKKLVGWSGKITFDDITNELIYKAYTNAQKRQLDGSLASRSYSNYMGSIGQLVTLANFLGVSNKVLNIPQQFTHLSKIKDHNYSITMMVGHNPEEVFKAIKNIKTIQQWQAVGFWLLSFCTRGFYYGDIVKLKQKDVANTEGVEIGHLLKTFMSDDIHIYHRRSKGEHPMYIKLFNHPTMSLIQRLKFVTAYTHCEKEIGGKNVVSNINDQLQIFDYDHKNNTIKHSEMFAHVTDKLRDLGLDFMKARKSFNQYGQRLELTEKVRQCLLGHKEGGVILKKHYDDHTLIPFLKKLDKHHFEVLEKFQIPEMYQRMLVKLKWLVMEYKLPKWILCQGAVVREGRKLKVLTGIVRKSDTFDTYAKRLQWTYIEDDKYRKFFLKDKRGSEDYWSDIDDIVKPDSTLQRVFSRLAEQQKEIKKAETKVFKLKVS
jgi:hypothetical protein